MEAKQLINCARRLLSLQAMYITFNKDGFAGLQRLKGMTRSIPSVCISEQNQSVVEAVLATHDWQRDINRTVMVHGMCNATPDFLEPIAKDVEHVKCGTHPAEGLMSKREKIKQETFLALANAIGTPHFEKEINDWGVTLDWEFVQIDELPAIAFRIMDAEFTTKLVSIELDGWSGRMGINQVWGDRRYSDPQQMRELIYSALTDYLDKSTAGV